MHPNLLIVLTETDSVAAWKAMVPEAEVVRIEESLLPVRTLKNALRFVKDATTGMLLLPGHLYPSSRAVLDLLPAENECLVFAGRRAAVALRRPPGPVGPCTAAAAEPLMLSVCGVPLRQAKALEPGIVYAGTKPWTLKASSPLHRLAHNDKKALALWTELLAEVDYDV